MKCAIGPRAYMQTDWVVQRSTISVSPLRVLMLVEGNQSDDDFDCVHARPDVTDHVEDLHGVSLAVGQPRWNLVSFRIAGASTDTVVIPCSILHV